MRQPTGTNIGLQQLHHAAIASDSSEHHRSFEIMYAPADVRQDNMIGAHARSSEAFEAEARAQQQHTLAAHPVRLVD
jgi:hypothetical protein